MKHKHETKPATNKTTKPRSRATDRDAPIPYVPTPEAAPPSPIPFTLRTSEDAARIAKKGADYKALIERQRRTLLWLMANVAEYTDDDVGEYAVNSLRAQLLDLASMNLEMEDFTLFVDRGVEAAVKAA